MLALMTVPCTGRGGDGKCYPSRALTAAERLRIARRVHQLRCAGGLTVRGVRAAVLQEHIMWRVPIEVKLRLLVQAIDTYDLSGTFPFAIPVLTRLFQVRKHPRPLP